MAAAATYFRRSDVIAAEETTRMEAADPYRLRGLPADNIYFFTKRVDNSRLVRAADPKTRKECWSTIATACLLAVMVGGAVSPRIGGVMTGYKVEKLKAEHRELIDRQRMLQIEEARLLSPARLDELAAKRQFAIPAQQIHLQPKDSALAMNSAPRSSVAR